MDDFEIRSEVEEALRWLPADALDTLDAADSEAMLYDTLTGSEDLDGPPERVLIADDNADMRDYLQRLLAPGERFGPQLAVE